MLCWSRGRDKPDDFGIANDPAPEPKAVEFLVKTESIMIDITEHSVLRLASSDGVIRLRRGEARNTMQRIR
jgi:hypothetical protein